MNCPLCTNIGQIEIDLHADGYCQDAFECGACGGVWTYSGHVLKIIKDKSEKKATAYSDFICPTCKSILCIETDLDAFQFHEEIQECTNCGTVCSSAHDQIEVIKDSQEKSFLSSTPEHVESDDYAFI
jgi:Zn-finger nucleic acid-binding protein